MIKLLIFSFLVSAILIACKKEKENEHGHSSEHSEALDEGHWEYQGELGPEHWADVEKFSDCSGNLQSPINIKTIEVYDGEPTLTIEDFNYEELTMVDAVSNNGHTIEYKFASQENSIMFEEDKYSLIQFHFHSPAEHTVDGVKFPLEIHWVHKNAQNEYLVLGLLAKQGEENAIMTTLESYLPLVQGETKPMNAEIDLMHGLDLKMHEEYYHYKGSLTTPPCSETVNWFLYAKPITVSEEQIQILQKLMPVDNYRDIQPLNGRQVLRATD